MLRTASSRAATALFLAAALAGTAACGSGGGAPAAGSATTHGPIKIWYSNNPEEVTWGKAMVSAWNAAHPTETVTAEEIPAGKTSEETIGASIAAGNAPCLVFNTAPAAVPQFQKQGGLVALDSFPGARDYIEQRSGARAAQYRSPDGKYYQLPWKSNPVMIFFNKKAFAAAGLDPANPKLSTYADFLDTARKVVAGGGAKYAISPAPSSEFFQPFFDFYPLFAAATGGKQLVVDGKAQFAGAEGIGVADFWKSLYDAGLSSREKYNGDSFADGVSAMAVVGPWAIAVYGTKVDWDVVPVPTAQAKPAGDISTFSDAKNVAMYSACVNRGTAWDLMQFATSKDQDGALLSTTGQMPMRSQLATTYPDYFAGHPKYSTFAAQAERTVEVPNVPNSITIWQTFRDAYSSSVIFGKSDVKTAMDGAAAKVNQLATP